MNFESSVTPSGARGAAVCAEAETTAARLDANPIRESFIIRTERRNRARDSQPDFMACRLFALNGGQPAVRA
jgi:hypothetical protein